MVHEKVVDEKFQKIATRIDDPENIHNFSENLEKKIKEAAEDQMYKYAGLGSTPRLESVPYYEESMDEVVVTRGKNVNATIVVGKDKPSAPGSGYSEKAASIDLVTGRYGRFYDLPKEQQLYTNDDAPILNQNDFVNDAARIYICERTNIDLNFGLVPGMVGNPRGRSAVGIKADNVRIMAREGIKLVTRPDQKNSKGADVDAILGVDIIAGDDDSDLQPMVKGENLKRLLLLLVDDSRRLAQMIHSITLSQMALETMLAAHTHSSPVAPAAPIVLPSFELAAVVATSQLKKFLTDVPSQIMHTLNNVAEEIEFLKPFGGRYINSKSNHVN